MKPHGRNWHDGFFASFGRRTYLGERLPQEDEGMSYEHAYDLEKAALEKKLAAKDAEIAELRAALSDCQHNLRVEQSASGSATAERDEARECVGRLYGILRLLYMSGEIAPGFWDEALTATPAHLR